MRPAVALLLAFLLPAGAAAADEPVSGTAPVEAISAPGEDAAAAAFRLSPIDIRMGVDVTINGAGPFHFIVDSGANRTVISRQLAHLLALPSAGTASLNSVGGVSQVETARIDALKLGGFTATRVIAPLLDQDDIGAAGILGIDALAGRSVVIDLATRRMTVGAVHHGVSAAARDGEIVVTARSRFGELVLADADIGGHHIYAIIDSGTDTTIGNPALRARLARRKHGEPLLATSLHDVAGHTVPIEFAVLKDVRIGTIHVQDLPVAFADAHAFRKFGLVNEPAMLIGMDLLRAFGRVSIDFARREVRFLPRQTDGMALRIDG